MRGNVFFNFYNSYIIKLNDLLINKNKNLIDDDVYKIGWVNYYKTKFTSLSQMISEDYNHLQLNAFLEISKLVLL